MYDWFSLVTDSGLADQAKSESLHLAFLAVAGGTSLVFSGLVATFTFLLRRDLKRSEDAKRVFENGLETRLAKIELSHAVLDERVSCNKDRQGSEIADTRIAMAPLFVRAELPQPNYPSR